MTPSPNREQASPTRLLIVCLLGVAVLALCSCQPLPEPLGNVPEFELTDSAGETFRSSQLEGKVWVASFVLVRCPDGKCPQVSASMKRLQQTVGNLPNVRLVTFTVDPARDDPDELARYAKGFDADPKRWHFLTGSEEQIDELLLEGFRVGIPSRKEDADPADAYSHSTKLVLVDQRGHILGYYPGLPDTTETDPQTAHDRELLRLEQTIRRVTMGEPDFPAINALLNAIAVVLLLGGYIAIRTGWTRTHVASMLLAILVSAVFLSSYLYYHILVREGVPTRFSEQAPHAPQWVAYTYLAIFATHAILAAVETPLILYTAWLGLRQRWERHVKVAKWTFPIWLYVSITGVVVYWMLYRLYAVI